MTRRIYVGPDHVTVSKPGYDAVSPPAIDYTYLALDSRLPSGRPLEIVYLPNFTITYGGNVYFAGGNYPDIPAVDIFAFVSATEPGTGIPYCGYTYSMAMRDANGSTAINRSSMYLGLFTDHFQFVDDAVYVRSSMFKAWTGVIYVAWQTWA